MTIDPRLAERRAEVAEDRARRNVGRLLRFLLAIALVGGLIWFALSPWMSVSEISVDGVEMSHTEDLLTAHRFIPGTPMVLLRPGPLEAQLREDPWVRQAEVVLNWPTHVQVTVEERVPRAWVQTAQGWSRRSEDGVAVPSNPSPDDTLGRILLPEIDDDPDLIVGAIAFIHALPEALARGTTMRLEGGELWASVDGFEVRLGRAVEMREKAVSLLALFDRGLAEGTVVILVAPSHPATEDPTPPPADPDDDSDGDGGEGGPDGGDADREGDDENGQGADGESGDQ